MHSLLHGNALKERHPESVRISSQLLSKVCFLSYMTLKSSVEIWAENRTATEAHSPG